MTTATKTRTQTLPKVFTQAPDELICTLIKAGWTQGQIADASDTTQSTICRIYNSSHKNTSYTIVDKLRQLVINLDEFQVAQ